MNEHDKRSIVEYDRHQFVYAKNDKKRKTFLLELDRDYKIKANENAPMTVYLTTDSLLILDAIVSPDGNKICLQSLAREQLSFTLAVAILEKMKRDIPGGQLESIVPLFLGRINELFHNKQFPPIETLDELISAFQKSASFHKLNFLKELRGEELDSFTSVEVPFLDITAFATLIKKALKNDSHFAILIDYQSKLSSYSHQAVNNLIGGRINSKISIKVVSEPEDWGLFFDMGGNRIDATHDYEEKDLDGSLKRYTEEQKRSYYDQFDFELGGFAESPEDIDGSKEEWIAFNHCLAEDYLRALLEEDFASLGEIGGYTLSTIAKWLNYDGEIGKENENIIAGIPKGTFMTNKGRPFEEAVVENHNCPAALALIENGNHNVELYLTLIINDEPTPSEDDLLNNIYTSFLEPADDTFSHYLEDEYCNFLESIFSRIGEHYDSLQDSSEKEQFLRQVKPYIAGIRIPKSFKDNLRLKEIAKMKSSSWQIELRKMMSKKSN